MDRIARTAASLRIFGDDLNPEEVSQLLGGVPTRTERKGDTRTLSGGSIRVAKTGSWMLWPADRVPGDLEGQIWEILNQLTSDLDVWNGLAARFPRLDLYCGLFMREHNDGLVLSPAALKALSDRNIELDLEIYAPETRDQEADGC